MSGQTSQEQDHLQLFKSKVEDAVGLVALIPDNQKTELLEFWERISDTIRQFTKFSNLEESAQTGAGHHGQNTADDNPSSENVSKKETNENNEQVVIHNSDMQVISLDFLDMVSSSGQISESFPQSPDARSMSSHQCLVYSKPSMENSSRETNSPIRTIMSTTPQRSSSDTYISADPGVDNSGDDGVSDDMDNYGDVEEPVREMEKPTEQSPVKQTMISLLENKVPVQPANQEIHYEINDGNETIEIHLPEGFEFNEGDILTPERLSMILNTQFDNIPAAAMDINLSKEDLPYQEPAFHLKTEPVDEQFNTVNNSNEKPNDDGVLIEIQAPAFLENVPPNSEMQTTVSEVNVGVNNENEINQISQLHSKRRRGRSKQIANATKRNVEFVEGDIITPDKVFDFLYNEEIDKEIKNDIGGDKISRPRKKKRTRTIDPVLDSSSTKHSGQDEDFLYNQEIDEEIRKQEVDDPAFDGKRRRQRRRKQEEAAVDSDDFFLPVKPRTIKRPLRRPRLLRVKPDITEYVCTVCGIKLSNQGALLVHTRKHSGLRPFACDQCDKSFTTKQNMQRHLLCHTGEKPFPCDVCKKCFTEKKSLIIHKRTHTGEKPYECTICLKRFTQSIVLQTHMQIHTNDKKHLCELCGKSFRQRTNLQSHKKRHLEEKRHDCPDCSYSFFTKGELVRHALRHTGEKPFQCDMCPKRFTRQQYLNEHLNVHIGNKPYSCNKCEEKFHDLSTYHRHLKKHKPKKGEEGKQENITETLTAGENDETTTTYLMESTGLLGQDALQQLQAVINSEVGKIQQQSIGSTQQFQTVILKGSSVQHVDDADAGTSVNRTVGVKDTNTDQVYQITMVDQSQEVVATVDFSAFNLLANATAKQYAISK